ncbi:MAG: hypothetical protein EAZ68_22310, partial [Oscillatoriales cyanobacterium]
TAFIRSPFDYAVQPAESKGRINYAEGRAGTAPLAGDASLAGDANYQLPMLDCTSYERSKGYNFLPYREV